MSIQACLSSSRFEMIAGVAAAFAVPFFFWRREEPQILVSTVMSARRSDSRSNEEKLHGLIRARNTSDKFVSLLDFAPGSHCILL